tara:strand:+ start:1010 stop:2002 length:993 start_codon:yes stop_codon:yes gene_type:complete
MTLKYGLLGCSNIAQKSFFPVMSDSKTLEANFIGSRSIEKSKEWAEKYDVPNYGSYEDVINSNVDVVYITLPIALHEEWAIKALNAGKHVLCEKSSTISLQSAIDMVAAAKNNKKRIMEGFSFRFHPQHKIINEMVLKELGQIQNFYGIYGFPDPADNDIRWQKELGGGVFNDMTCYPICAIREIFGDTVESVFSQFVIDERYGVDRSNDIMINFNDGKSAHISAGFNNYYQSKYILWGSEGRLTTKRAYAVPPTYQTSVFLDKDDQIVERTIKAADQFSIMLDVFSKAVTGERTEPFNFEKDLVKQAKLMEAIRISAREKKLVYLSELD